jgi:hypothetical protein
VGISRLLAENLWILSVIPFPSIYCPFVLKIVYPNMRSVSREIAYLF